MPRRLFGSNEELILFREAKKLLIDHPEKNP